MSREEDKTVKSLFSLTSVLTCFAFDKSGIDCSSEGDDACSVDGAASGLADGVCLSNKCTYTCHDGTSSNDAWCSDSITYGTTTPFMRLCKTN